MGNAIEATVVRPMEALARQIAEEEAVLRQGGGKAGQERQRALGRLPVRERIARLLDDPEDFLEIGLWAGYRMYEEVGAVPAAGVIAGIGRVAGRSVMVIANDASVKAGSFFPATAKKCLRAQRIAYHCQLPVLYLVDAAGAYLPMQDEVFPDEDDFGRIFRNNAVFSAQGLPQYAAIMGNCVAGGAYLPILCDKTLMTEGSALYLAGPALVKAAIGQIVDTEDLGGARMHSTISGNIDFHEPNDESCLDRLRELVGLLPSNPWADSPLPEHPAPARPADSLFDLISVDGRKEYDVRDLLAAVVDADSLIEYKAEYGKTIVTTYAKIGGQTIGIVANQKIRQKTAEGELQLGGVIYPESAEKAARFIMDCNQTGLPLLFVQDVQGFMVGRSAEHDGIIRRGAKMLNAMANSIVPKITLIVGGSFGAGNYVMCGKAFDPTFLFAWPNAKYAVMGADQAANTLLTVQKKNAERLGKDLGDDDLKALFEKIKGDYLERMDIRYGAARGWVDAIIQPQDTRKVLIRAFECVRRRPITGPYRTGVFQV